MKTKKNKPVAFAVDGSPKSPDSAPSAPPVSEREDDLQRVSFNINADGSPDWVRMRGNTRARLLAILKTEEVQKELGFTPEQAKEIANVGFGEDEANALLDLLSGVDSIAASKIFGIPYEVTSQAYAFTPFHRGKINPPMIKVLNKWSPLILKTWKDEIGLAIVLVSTLNAQTRLMHILDEKRKRALPAQAPAPSKITEMQKPEERKTETPPAPAPAPAAKAPEPENPPDMLENVGFKI